MEIALLFLPLMASITSGFFGKYIGDKSSEIITSLFVSISAFLSLILFYEVISNTIPDFKVSYNGTEISISG